MGRPRKYEGLHDRNKKYHSTEKGKAAIKKYESSDARKASQRERARIRRGTIVDKRQWFIDTYGDIETALKLLDKREQFVVIHLNGLDGNPPMTQEAVGEELFLTGSRIGQIYKGALNKLAPLKEDLDSNAAPEK